MKSDVEIAKEAEILTTEKHCRFIIQFIIMDEYRHSSLLPTSPVKHFVWIGFSDRY